MNSCVLFCHAKITTTSCRCSGRAAGTKKNCLEQHKDIRSTTKCNFRRSLRRRDWTQILHVLPFKQTQVIEIFSSIVHLELPSLHARLYCSVDFIAKQANIRKRLSQRQLLQDPLCLPTGADFSLCLNQGQYIVDKTHFIPAVLGEKWNFCLRPRRFGKSLSLSILFKMTFASFFAQLGV